MFLLRPGTLPGHLVSPVNEQINSFRNKSHFSLFIEVHVPPSTWEWKGLKWRINSKLSLIMGCQGGFLSKSCLEDVCKSSLLGVHFN
jgi:hypothetical protein